MLIGLTQRVLFNNGISYDSIEHGWYKHLENHTLYFIPNTQKQNFEEISNKLDLLIITGGDDLALRRVVETKLATEMLKRQKPILGVCHGCFFLADLLGSQINEIENHHNVEHNVMYKNTYKTVNSYHSLCISKIHDSGTVLATDDNDNVEAWIDGTISGVVWHPERSNDFWLPNEITNLTNLR